MKIIIASNNVGKVREFKQLLAPLGYEAISQSEAGVCISVAETGDTFEKNAALKARAIYKKTGLPVISDDSGLCVDALDGEPGVYSANYDNAWLLERMKDVPADKRTARFVCCICYVNGDGKEHTKFVHGECEGQIAFSEQGENGFGYDPVFLYLDSRQGFKSPVHWQSQQHQSFAEMSADDKNAVSHRGKALREFVQKLEGGW
ncbi:MAG: RdgB/HAM1 family non-canonical purine NTP pyrophosphatase [Oscillospiraceae bacterium]|nr:RdgB/HAM1 family non-canonical purine NTP pyrophosphatase [Oscillospiraceae bacterium]